MHMRGSNSVSSQICAKQSGNSSAMSEESDFLSKTISIRGLMAVLLFASCILTITGFLGKFDIISAQMKTYFPVKIPRFPFQAKLSSSLCRLDTPQCRH